MAGPGSRGAPEWSERQRLAATRLRDSRPVWIVTGTDDRGVGDAARALEQVVLTDKFALAIDDGRGIGLPDVPR